MFKYLELLKKNHDHQTYQREEIWTRELLGGMRQKHPRMVNQNKNSFQPFQNHLYGIEQHFHLNEGKGFHQYYLTEY